MLNSKNLNVMSKHSKHLIPQDEDAGNITQDSLDELVSTIVKWGVVILVVGLTFLIYKHC